MIDLSTYEKYESTKEHMQSDSPQSAWKPRSPPAAAQKTSGLCGGPYYILVVGTVQNGLESPEQKCHLPKFRIEMEKTFE